MPLPDDSRLYTAPCGICRPNDHREDAPHFIEHKNEPFITVDSVSHMVSSVIRDGDVDRRRFTLTNLEKYNFEGCASKF